MYPVLKYNVKLKKSAPFCWLYSPGNAKDCVISQYAAFILTLMDGQWTSDDLKLIVGTVYNSDERIGAQLVDNVIQDFDRCIEWRQDAGKGQMRYDPQDFLFNSVWDESSELERLETPNILAIAITEACNFRCVYCFNASAVRSPGELSGDEWCSVIDQARDLGVFQVLVTGGEPTMHPDLMMILRKLKTADLDFKLFTNGGTISDELCGMLEGANVQVSLDTADRTLHRRLTGADTFDAVIGAIGRLVKRGACVSVKSVITAANTEGLPELHRLCESLGVTSLSFNRFDVSPGGRGSTDMRVTSNQRETIRKVYAGLKASNTQVYLDVGKDEWTEPADTVGCGAFRSSMIISSRGDLIGCEKIAALPEMIIGNLRENTLAELWKSPKIDSFIANIRHTNDSKCRGCRIFAKCRTGCFAEKQYFEKPFFGADPRCRL